MKLLVTGASRGIGRAVARQLHARGAKLALSARTLANLGPVLAETPGSVAVPADLIDATEVDELAGRAREALAGLDGFVHCAGLVWYTPALEVTRTELDMQLAVNFVAPVRLSQHVARELISAGAGSGGTTGSIVHVASTLATHPAAGTAAYAASKAALIAWTRALALELAPHAIRVNAVAPGVIDTEMVRVVRSADRESLSPEELERRIQQQLVDLAALHPLGRLGTADEVAEAVAYLMYANFVTGTVLVVDGGLTLR